MGVDGKHEAVSNRSIGWALGVAMLGIGLGLAFGIPAYFNRFGSADRIEGAALIDGEGGRTELVVLEQIRHSSKGGGLHDNRLSFFDPSTGARLRRRVIFSGVGPRLWPARGGRCWLWADHHELELHDVRGAVKATASQIATANPQVAQPWRDWSFDADGNLAVEAGDQRVWRIDPQSLSAVPSAPSRMSDRHFTFKDSEGTWEPADGVEVGFQRVATQGWAEKETFYLVRGPRREGVEAPRPFGDASFPGPGVLGFPRFLFDGFSGKPLTFADPEQVLVEWDRPTDDGRVFALLGADGRPAWRRPLDLGHRTRVERAFAHQDGVVLVRGKRIIRLRRSDGSVVFDREL
jgi:hypothetical protein